jgi:hypothetical protein
VQSEFLKPTKGYMISALGGAEIVREGPNSTLLKGIYALVQVDGELHLKQRWVEVHETAIVVFVKREEAPLCIYSLHQIEIFDEGNRDFSIELRPLPTPPPTPPPPAALSSMGGTCITTSAQAHVHAADDDDPSAPHFEEATFSSRSTSNATETGSLDFETDDDAHHSGIARHRKGNDATPLHPVEHHVVPLASEHITQRVAAAQLPPPHHIIHEVGAHHASPDDEDVATVRFRCCDRIECLEMLQFVEQAFHALRLRSVACQVELKDFHQMMISEDAYRTLCSELDRLRATNSDLTTRVHHQAEANALLQSQMKDLRCALSALEMHNLNLQSENEQLREENLKIMRDAEDGAAMLREKFAVSLAEAKRRLDEKQLEIQQLLASGRQAEVDSAAAAKERDALRRQLAEALQRLKKRPAPSLNGAGAIAGLESFLNVRRDHLSWIRHHLCAVQIARFALSLKRASQILAHIPGSSQFAKEFGHDWPIASRLIELPAMIVEEDRMLEGILCTYRGVKGLGGGGRGNRGTSIVSPPQCAAPSCGGTPSEIHTCAALTIDRCDHDEQEEHAPIDSLSLASRSAPCDDTHTLSPPGTPAVISDASNGSVYIDTALPNAPASLHAKDSHLIVNVESSKLLTSVPHDAPIACRVQDDRTRLCMDQCSNVPALSRYCCGRLGQGGPCHSDYEHQPLKKTSSSPPHVRANGIRVFLRGTSVRGGSAAVSKSPPAG